MPRCFVILDRDGTLIRERHYLADPDQVELSPGAAESLCQLRGMGLGLVLVTNQSGIGRGLFDLAALERVHQRMKQLLHYRGAWLDGIYFCPHRPDEACNCRKPAPGMIEKAARELRFDPHESFVIGDRACDIELGQRVGATTCLVLTGYGGQAAKDGSIQPDYVVDDLASAVPRIAARIAGGVPPSQIQTVLRHS